MKGLLGTRSIRQLAAIRRPARLNGLMPSYTFKTVLTFKR